MKLQARDKTLQIVQNFTFNKKASLYIRATKKWRIYDIFHILLLE